MITSEQDKNTLSKVSDLFKWGLRLLGGMLVFMGAATCLIVLIGSSNSRTAGLIAAGVLFAIGFGMFKLAGLFSEGLLERLSGVRVNSQTGKIETVDGNKEVFVEKFDTVNGTAERMVIRDRPVDANGRPVESSIVKNAYTIDDRGRFILQSGRSIIRALGGGVFLLAGLLLANGYHAVLGRENWEFGFFQGVLVIGGLAFVALAGLAQGVEIDKREDKVSRHWSWFFLYYGKRYRLNQFDHILINRAINQGVSDSYTQISYRIILCGNESMHFVSFDDIFDARALAQKVSEYTGFPVKEDL